MTATLTRLRRPVVAAEGVHVPQQDSRLLIETLTRSTAVLGRRALDLCPRSGVVATAAELRTVGSLRSSALSADVVVSQLVPFRPVVSARATGLQLVVFRARKG